jgi:acetyl-CoA acetyltransferase
MVDPRDPVVVGVHVTEQARSLPGRTSHELLIEAVKGALADAGLDRREVDGVALEWPGPGGAPGDSASWAPYFGAPLKWVESHFMDTTGVRGVLKAGAAIRAGLCDTVVIGSARAGPFNTTGAAVGSGMGLEWIDPYGASTMAYFALVARRHMHQFGTTPEQMAHVAAVIRNHGRVNSEAALHGGDEVTVADVLASPMIADPLHRLDCCLMNEGGHVLILTTAERARDLGVKGVRVAGGAMEFAQGNYINPPLYRDVRTLGVAAARRALGMAGVGIGDIDVFSIYDPCSFEVLRQFEMLGLCGEGEGGDFCAGDRLTLGGQCPTNLDGGMLAGSWTGTSQLTGKVIEGVRQLRGHLGARQVEGAEVALVSNAGSGAQHLETLVLTAA